MAWIKAIEFADEIVKMVVGEYIAAVEMQMEQIKRFDQKLQEISQRPEYAAKVAAYSVLRGIQTLGALTIIAAAGDLRQYGQAPQFMAALVNKVVLSTLMTSFLRSVPETSH